MAQLLHLLISIFRVAGRNCFNHDSSAVYSIHVQILCIVVSHRVSEMGILQIRLVLFAHFSAYTFLLLFRYPTLQCFLVSSAVLPDVIQSPYHNQDELKPKTRTCANSSGNVSRSIGFFEDLATAHVANAVAQKRRRRNDSLLGSTGNV